MSSETTSLDRLAYDVREVAAAIGSSEAHVYNEVRRNKLRALKSGSRTIITASELRRYLDSLPDAVMTYRPRSSGAA